MREKSRGREERGRGEGESKGEDMRNNSRITQRFPSVNLYYQLCKSGVISRYLSCARHAEQVRGKRLLSCKKEI